MTPQLLRLKAILETIENGQAPQTTLDDLIRIYGYDPKQKAREALSLLADIVETTPTADNVWNALRDVGCVTGRRAVRIVIVHKHDVEKAMALLPKQIPEQK